MAQNPHLCPCIDEVEEMCRAMVKNPYGTPRVSFRKENPDYVYTIGEQSSDQYVFSIEDVSQALRVFGEVKKKRLVSYMEKTDDVPDIPGLAEIQNMDDMGMLPVQEYLRHLAHVKRRSTKKA